MKAGKPKEVLVALRTYLDTVNRTFKPTDLTHSLQSFRATVATLKKDTDRCQDRYEQAFKVWLGDRNNQAAYELLQFELRQLIRTFFAEVEGTIYSGRQVILWSYERGEIDLTAPEVALLREESYRFNRKTKKAESRPVFSSTLDTLLLTLTVLPRLFGSIPLDPRVPLRGFRRSAAPWATLHRPSGTETLARRVFSSFATETRLDWRCTRHQSKRGRVRDEGYYRGVRPSKADVSRCTAWMRTGRQCREGRSSGVAPAILAEVRANG